jgi:hypothetical protein
MAKGAHNAMVKRRKPWKEKKTWKRNGRRERAMVEGND